MSGSPPPEQPAEPPQIAGRRRKRSYTPPPTTTAAASLAPSTPLDTTNPVAAALTRGGGETLGELPSQHRPYGVHYPPRPTSYHAGSSILPSSANVVEPRFALSPISPRATRKPKAHVASACVNCKKKHLRCDSSRPCRRCVQSGKEDTCVDVEHKKRGRPPLKPDDPTNPPRYQHTEPQYQSSIPAAMGPLRGPTSYPAYSQGLGLAPILPSPSPWFPQPSRGVPSYYPPPARPSISPSLATAEGSFISSNPGQYGAPPPLQSQPPLTYTGHTEQDPRPPTYVGYNYPQPQGPAYGYANPIFPRLPSSTVPSEPPPPQQHPSSFQLPPLNLTTTAGAIDPAIVQQQGQSRVSPQGERSSRDDDTRERDAKRPKMDIRGILGPRND